MDKPSPPAFEVDLEKIERPPLMFEFKGDRTPIKMTYGLEMDLRRLLPDPQTAMQLILHDAFTQDYVIRRCLTEKNKIITDFDELISFEEVDIDGEETDRLLIWATQHAIYFFMKRTAGLGQLGVQLEKTMAQTPPVPLTPSTTGSETSASTTPSAGPSESSKES